MENIRRRLIYDFNEVKTVEDLLLYAHNQDSRCGIWAYNFVNQDILYIKDGVVMGVSKYIKEHFERHKNYVADRMGIQYEDVKRLYRLLLDYYKSGVWYEYQDNGDTIEEQPAEENPVEEKKSIYVVLQPTRFEEVNTDLMTVARINAN